MTTTAIKNRKSKGKSVEAGLSATEANLLEETVAPVVAEEAKAAEQEAIKEEQSEPTTASAIDTPDDAEDSDEETEEQDMKAARKSAEKLLDSIHKAAWKAETSSALAWLEIGKSAMDYAKLCLSIGDGYDAVQRSIELKIGGFTSYASDKGEVEKLLKAAACWGIYCDLKGLKADKERETVGRSIPWMTWFRLLSTLVSRSVAKEGDNYTVSYSFLPHVEEKITTLIANVIDKKDRMTNNDVNEKTSAIRGESYKLVSEESERLAKQEAEKEKEAREKETAARKAHEEAAAKEKAAKEEKERLVKEAAEKIEEAKQAAEAAENEELSDDERDEAEERAAIMEEEAAAAKRAAQEAKEEEERARQKKEEEAKKAAEERQAIEDAKKTKEAAERVAQTAGKQVEKIEEEAKRRTARLNGESSGSSKPKTERKEDQGENIFQKAKEAKPVDLAGWMFAMMKANPMSATVLKEFVNILNSKDGAALFAADKTTQEVIVAAVVAYEECAAEGEKK